MITSHPNSYMATPDSPPPDSQMALGVDHELVSDGFPRTYIRNMFGLRLSEDQQSGRAAGLDAWLKRMVESPDLPVEAAVRLAMFLDVSVTYSEGGAASEAGGPVAEEEAKGEVVEVDPAQQ